MDALVVSSDPAQAEQVYSLIDALQLDVRLIGQISVHEALSGATTHFAKAPPAVIFFASVGLETSELESLAELCAKFAGQAKVAVCGQSYAPDVILQAIRCGATDYIPLNDGFRAEATTLLKRIQSGQKASHIAGKVISVLRTTGGVGASFISLNLAVALATRFGKCGLLDFQMRGGALAVMLKCNPRYTLLSLAEKLHHLDATMFQQSLVSHSSGVELLAGPELFADIRAVTPDLTQRLLTFSRALWPFTVVDVEDCAHPEQIRTLAESDQIVIPYRLDFVSLNGTKRLIEFLQKSGIPPSQITPVANRAGQPKEIPFDRVHDLLGVPTRHSIPDDAAAVNPAVNLGEPIVTMQPRSAVSEALIRLAVDVSGVPLEKSQSASRISDSLGRLRQVVPTALARLTSAIV
jgi:pilus assembly protein CpaE